MAEFFDAAVKLALKVKAETKGLVIFFLSFLEKNFRLYTYNDRFLINVGTKLKDFVATLSSDSKIQSEIAKLKQDVEDYAKQFPTIGFEKETMKYKD